MLLALCGCMDCPLVLRTSSTGAEVTGIQTIFSNSSCKSALYLINTPKVYSKCSNQYSFFYVIRSQSSLSSSIFIRRIVIVIIILCRVCRMQSPRKFQGLKSGDGHFGPRWSSTTRTFIRGNNTVFSDLATSLWSIALRDIWRNVFFSWRSDGRP